MLTSQDGAMSNKAEGMKKFYTFEMPKGWKYTFFGTRGTLYLQFERSVRV